MGNDELLLAHFDRHALLDWIGVLCFVVILTALFGQSLRKIAPANAAGRVSRRTG